MTEIQPELGKGRLGSLRSTAQADRPAKLSVAFLLLTFFILTTNLSANTNKQVAEDQDWKVSNCEDDPIQQQSFFKNGEVIALDLEEARDQVFSIKASLGLPYMNLVDILDEMQVVRVPQGSLIAFTDNDRGFLREKGLKQYG